MNCELCRVVRVCPDILCLYANKFSETYFLQNLFVNEKPCQYTLLNL